jgi:hypothetical protein
MSRAVNREKKMFSKTTLVLAVAIVLGTAFPALAATKHHYRNAAAAGSGCTASGGPACSSACTGYGPCAPPDTW